MSIKRMIALPIPMFIIFFITAAEPIMPMPSGIKKKKFIRKLLLSPHSNWLIREVTDSITRQIKTDRKHLHIDTLAHINENKRVGITRRDRTIVKRHKRSLILNPLNSFPHNN